MDYRRKVRRNQIIVVVAITVFVIGCSFLVGFNNLINSILFLLPALVLIPLGGYFIIKRFVGRRQYLLFALWISFTFAVTSVVGMLLDERTYPLDWRYASLVAGIVWLVSLIFILIGIPIYLAIVRTWKDK